MREIKFRGLKKQYEGEPNGNEKEWVYGYLVKEGGFAYIYDEQGKKHYVNWESATQFTGLKDKNGKEIYEGDIVKDLMDNPAEVKFGKYSAGGLDYYASEAYGFYVQIRTKGEEVNGDTQTLGCYGEEVIGNIYESPQLLEHATN